MSDTCQPEHDWFTASLTTALCLGLVLSYGPQHLKIINKNSSEGFSPWYLLLGSTSSAAGMLNMVIMQWGIIKCCRVLTLGSCIEMTGGVFQVVLQWFLFTVILVLYMIYYPSHLKYADIDIDSHDTRPSLHVKTPIQSNEWRLSIILTWVVVFHLIFISFTTFFLLLTAVASPSPTSPPPYRVSVWATFLGVSSALLAAIQYAPQLMHTYKTKVVGALSIPMMVIQTPGAAVMVLSIALRPGTDWTSWITFAVSGILQGTLLVMCIIWKFRQRRLNIDDFGHSLYPEAIDGSPLLYRDYPDEDVPRLVIVDEEDRGTVQAALATALGQAVEEDVRDENPSLQVRGDVAVVGEEFPLLGREGRARKDKRSWLSWFNSA